MNRFWLWILLPGVFAPLAAEEEVLETWYDEPDWWSVSLKAGVVPGISRFHARAMKADGTVALDRRIDLHPGVGAQVAAETRWQSWRDQQVGLAVTLAPFARWQSGSSGGMTARMTSFGLEAGIDLMWGPADTHGYDLFVGPRLALAQTRQSETGLALFHEGQGMMASYGVTAGAIMSLPGDAVLQVEIGYQGFVAATDRTVVDQSTLTGHGSVADSGQGLVLSIGAGFEL